ncbi:MAG: mechanosensitive ion channel [Xanthomonadales bacterium]|nr:mechanosensitive ion channel [Xanthomonadales bacterium]
MEALQSYFAEADLTELAISIGLRLLLVLLIYVVGRWLAKAVQRMVEKLLRKRKVDEVLVDFIGTIANAVVTIAAVVAALDTLGIPATSLVAVVGAASLAIGLALKDSLANFAAGVMLVLFRPFTKGDFVEAGGQSGTVEEVYLVSTVLTTPDNKVIQVPNSAVWGGSITNFSAKDTRRVDLVIGVGYDDDLKVASDVLKKILADHPKVLDDPAPAVFVSNLGDSSVDFAVRPWVASADYWGVYSDVLQQAKLALEEAGVSIPYPQQDVHMHTVESAA